MKKLQNQTTRPTINKIGKTQQEPKRVRVHFKSGNATILICKGIDHYDAIRLESRIKRYLNDIGVKLEGTFIQTQ